MKRSGFKKPTFAQFIASSKKSRKALKSSKPKPKKLDDIKKLRKKLWELCKQITRKQYGNTCYTCGKKDLVGSSWHTGHFIPSSTGGILLRYDLRNLRPQCYHCNINLGGNGSEFYRKLVEEKGQRYVDSLFILKGSTAKADRMFYDNKIGAYEVIIAHLQKDESMVVDDPGLIL